MCTYIYIYIYIHLQIQIHIHNDSQSNDYYQYYYADIAVQRRSVLKLRHLNGAFFDYACGRFLHLVLREREHKQRHHD